MENILKLFARTGDAVWAVGADYRIRLWNAAAEELLGYTAQEALGQVCHQLVAGCDPDGEPICAAECPVAECAERGRPVNAFDMHVLGPDGQLDWLNVSIITIPDTSGSRDGMALVHLGRAVNNGKRLSAPPLRIHLLGNLMVQRADGSPVGGSQWRQPAVRALLAQLALQRGKPIHRERLVKTLWPELAYPVALKRLGDAVQDLRASLEPEGLNGDESRYVHYEGGHFTLNGSRVHWLDIEAFEEGIARARLETDSQQATAAYREALALYQGDLLAELSSRFPASEKERGRLRKLYLSGMDELAELCTQHRDSAPQSARTQSVEIEPAHSAQ
jgi:PAS domain S-box-containing protein